MSATWLLLLLLAQVDKPPLEAHSTLKGQDALNAHVGTLGFQDGFGLTYRHLGPPSGNNVDTVLGAWAPFSFVTVGGGIQYVRLNGGFDYVQGMVGFALRPIKSLSFALVYKPFTGLRALTGITLSSWDFGIGWRPTRWLSWTVGVEAFNQPYEAPDFQLYRTYALGVAVRPLRNDWITLGFDARLRESGDSRLWPAPRFTLDFRPLSWLGLLTSVTTGGEFFVGLSLRERHLDAGGGVGLSPQGGLSGSYAFARYQSEPREGIDLTGKKTMQLGLKGDLRPADGLWILNMAKPPFGEIPVTLYALAERNDVKAVRLVFKGFDCNMAALHDVRDAIVHLRKRGKHVYAELGDADDRDLYVASAADEILMEPEGTLMFNGIKVTLRTFKGALDKLGARVEVEATGNYKNSPDAFTKDEPSQYQLEAQNALVDRFYTSLIDGVAAGRKLPKTKVEELIGRAVFTAEEAKAVGLIDDFTRDPDPAARLVPSRYDNLWSDATPPARDDWHEPPSIALVQIKGVISGGDSFEDPFGLFPIAGARTIVRQLEEARHDNDVKAVVVRIDSPGGDILASDFIWQAMRRMKATKPLIVSMGDVAASGGYYAALPADVIFAQPETVTGSIGVFAFKLDLSGLYDKLGIKHFTLKRGEHADLFDNTRGLTGGEHKILSDYVYKGYRSFLQKVSHARGLSMKEVDAIARGRVWNGKDAYERRLVDKLGGVVAAIAEAKRRAGYDDADVVMVQPGFGRFTSEVQAKLGLHGESGDIFSYVARIGQVLSAKAMYLFPYQLNID